MKFENITEENTKASAGMKLQHLTEIIETKSIPGMVPFAEVNQAPSCYLMLQHIGRVETPKLVPRNCLRYLQTTLIMGEGDCSQNLCELL